MGEVGARVVGVAELAAEVGDGQAQRLAPLVIIFVGRPIERIDRICFLLPCLLFDCFLWVPLRYHG